MKIKFSFKNKKLNDNKECVDWLKECETIVNNKMEEEQAAAICILNDISASLSSGTFDGTLLSAKLQPDEILTGVFDKDGNLIMDKKDK